MWVRLESGSRTGTECEDGREASWGFLPIVWIASSLTKVYDYIFATLQFNTWLSDLLLCCPLLRYSHRPLPAPRPNKPANDNEAVRWPQPARA